MLKIPKGLKKKKKGKKSKRKEEELFDSAELEQYRREQQLKQQEAAGAETAEGGETENSEEWQKFKALTSGVDDILKKTQGDLDRIKSTSYFQKKPPGPSTSSDPKEAQQPSIKVEQEHIKEKWVGFEEGGFDDEKETTEEAPAPLNAEEAAAAFEAEDNLEEEEEGESEFEDDQDDIFDTSYVDVVASGEVKLAYVPDSPEKEEDGFDPFDTSIVDKVIKVDPLEEKKKKLVSLGCAVEVLTGKLEKASGVPEAVKPQRRRPRAQDLLLGSFDEGLGADVECEPELPPKSILDEDPVFEEETSAVLGLPPVTPLVESKLLVSAPKVVRPEEKKNLDLNSLVDEFIPSFGGDKTPEPLVEPVQHIEDDLDDEFAALAAESLSKQVEEKKPSRPPRPELPQVPVDFIEDDFNAEDDPFDTSFASQVLPGKFELRLIEKEILEDNVPQLNKVVLDSKIQEAINKSEGKFQQSEHPNNFEEEVEFSTLKPLEVKHRDLLGGSTTDLSQIVQNPIVPANIIEDIPDFSEVDPFDTSVVDNLVAPGKTELKFLEKEFLDEPKPAIELVEEEDDDDFDPRAEDKANKPAVVRPDNLTVGAKRFSVPKVVAFDVKSPSKLPDLLAVEQEENSKVGKPLTPYYPTAGAQEIVSSDIAADPFDTSFVSNCPGKLELKLIEKELVAEEPPVLPKQQSLSDEDFDPRGGAKGEHLNTHHPSNGQDIISGDVESENKLHTPVIPRKIDDDFDLNQDFDPFDTSIATGLVPGKAEIKILETELIYAKENPPVNVSSTAITEALIRKSSQSSSPRLSVSDVLEISSGEIAVKPLTPLAASSFDLDDTSDPFDTSAIGEIAPGKTELKILESELMKY